MEIRRSNERGGGHFGWLHTKHTFSFGNYYDPSHMGFRNLRVLNEDIVTPGSGFGSHSHRDAEILSYVLQGALEHRDSMGHTSVIVPGDVQHMSAGTGVTHSEYNHSKEEPVHFLQIWFLPKERGIKPSYDQVHFPFHEQPGKLHLIASPDGRDHSLAINQDVRVYAGKLDTGHEVHTNIDQKRHVWIQVAQGELNVRGETLFQGDGVSLHDLSQLTILANKPSELLLFDLA
jgi:quercetin 2,3-dioxygenase